MLESLSFLAVVGILIWWFVFSATLFVKVIRAMFIRARERKYLRRKYLREHESIAKMLGSYTYKP
jgi:hypothetical protein